MEEELTDEQMMARLGAGSSSVPDELSDEEMMARMAPKNDPSKLDSAGRGVAQGASFGLRDEGAGFLKSPTGALKEIANKFGADFSDEDIEAYRAERDASRALDAQAKEANPNSYMAGEIGGGIATAFVPGLGLAKGASLAKTIATAGLQGATYGIGDSEGANIGEIARDAATGTAIGSLGGTFGYGLGKGVSGLASKVPAAKNLFNKGLSKLASVSSGVDEEAALRAIQRPAQLTAADADGFAYNLARDAQTEIMNQGDELGSRVGRARDDIVRSRGAEVVPGTDDLVMESGGFLARNKPSQAGFSGITPKEAGTITQLQKGLENATAEDLVKVREYIDGQVSHLYGKEGSATPFERQLMKMRGQADQILDGFDPALNQANKDYSRFVEDKSVLGLNNERTIESVADNLYSGANKTAKQNAAERLLPPDKIQQFRDIAANKSFENASRPGGDNYFRRGALGVLSLGTSELATNPNLQRAGLKMVGRAQMNIADIVQKNPQAFGKFSNVLRGAVERGPQAVAATHFILESSNPEYRETLKQLNGDGEQ